MDDSDGQLAVPPNRAAAAYAYLHFRTLVQLAFFNRDALDPVRHDAWLRALGINPLQGA